MAAVELRPGQRVGLWTLLHYVPGRNRPTGGRTKASWLCRCICGFEKTVDCTELRREKSRGCASCRAVGKEQTSMKPGDKVGEWTLLSYERGTFRRGSPRKLARWLCQCSCGVVREVLANNLTNRSSKSCGHNDPRAVTRYSHKNYRPANSVFALGGH